MKSRLSGTKPLSEPVTAKINDTYMRHSASMCSVLDHLQTYDGKIYFLYLYATETATEISNMAITMMGNITKLNQMKACMWRW